MRCLKAVGLDRETEKLSNDMVAKQRSSVLSILHSVEILGNWEPKTKDDVDFLKKLQNLNEFRQRDISEDDLSVTVELLARPDTEKTLARLAGEMNAAMEFEVERQDQSYSRKESSTRQLATKSYYFLALLAAVSVGVGMPVALTVTPWALIPASQVLISGLFFARIGLLTVSHTISTASMPDQGVTKYELLANTRSSGKRDLASMNTAHEQASDIFSFAKVWCRTWLAITAGTALAITIAILEI